MAVLEALAMLTGVVLLIGMALKLMNEGSIVNYQLVVGMLLAIMVVGAVLPGTIMNIHFDSPFGDGTGPTPTPAPIPVPGGPDGMNLTGPGTYYLTGDVNITTQAIWFQGDDITLDCQGYTITLPLPAPIPCVYAASSNNIRITDCTITGCSLGIQFQDVSNSTVDHNNLAINLIGIQDSDGAGNVFRTNNISNNAEGINLIGGNDSDILYNVLNGHAGDAIVLEDTNNSFISNNSMDNNGDDGIELDVSFDNQVYYNNVTNSGMDGIYLIESEGNNIYRNFVENSTGAGIYLEDALYNTIDMNTINLCADGLEFEYTTEDNYVLNNVVENSSNFDFTCLDAYNQSDSGNNACGTVDGCDDPPNDWLTSCPSSPPAGSPLLTCQVLSTGIYYLADDVDVNGTSPCFEFNTSDVVLDCDYHSLTNATGSDTAIAWYGVDNITVENCDIWDFQTGIEVVNSTDMEIYNNQLGDNYNGISVTNSIGLISLNWLDNNTGAGIYLEGVNDSAIILNNLYGNYDGIQAEYGDSNTYNLNYASNNTAAAYSFLQEGNGVFTHNEGYDNGGAGGYGFYLYNTTLNTFDNNTIQNSTAADFYCEEIPVGVDEDTGDNVCDTATTCTWMGIDGGGASPQCGADST